MTNMVKLAGTHNFDAPKSEVWEALLDPDVLSRILPGCKRLDKTADNEFSGEISIRVGPVQGSFNGKVTLDEIDPPNGYRMEIAGQGRPGYVKGVGTLRLEGDGPTTLHYDGDAQLSGRIASVGQRLVDSTARSLTRQGLQSLESIIAARLQPAEPEATAPSNGTEAASESSATAGAPGPAPPASSAGAAAQPEVATPSTMEVGINVARDVAADLAKEIQHNGNARKVLYILAGFAALVWMWRQLFGKAK
ncbi:MAG: carbon monoxide dehydrogenase subunit G [Caldilineaceae bacterium SB0668_bin_21]|nr:carbon monoxide dehydrogenase subunit G [Caldilineaceae bacterium SB0668_bin_21]MYC23477.1 carbon monoxide dehydrogenase subunit G [Caldilineaceae bacterium SB0662_bin_25]